MSFLNEPKGFFSNRWLTCIIIDEKKCGISVDQIISEFEKIKLKLDVYGSQCICNQFLKIIHFMGTVFQIYYLKKEFVCLQEVISEGKDKKRIKEKLN